MKKKSKGEFLVYLVLTISGVCLVISLLMLFIGLIIRIFTELDVVNTIIIIHRVFLFLFTIFGLLFALLSSSIDIFGKKICLEPIKLSNAKMKKFKSDLILSLISDKYEDKGILSNQLNCEIRYFFKDTISYRYIYVILDYKSENLEQHVIDNYLNFCLKELKISEIETKNVAITTVFLVKNNNPVFKKACDRLVFQGEHNFHLPIYVDCQNGVIYFSAQANEMWENVYKRLWNTFKTYIKDDME